MPHSNSSVEGRHYSADAEGLIREVSPDHVATLVRFGCVATDPFVYEQPKSPPAPPAPPKPKTVTVKAPPYSNFQPRTGHRYTAAADGLIEVELEDYKAMLRMGAEPVASEL